MYTCINGHLFLSPPAPSLPLPLPLLFPLHLLFLSSSPFISLSFFLSFFLPPPSLSLSLPSLSLPFRPQEKAVDDLSSPHKGQSSPTVSSPLNKQAPPKPEPLVSGDQQTDENGEEGGGGGGGGGGGEGGGEGNLERFSRTYRKSGNFRVDNILCGK